MSNSSGNDKIVVVTTRAQPESCSAHQLTPANNNTATATVGKYCKAATQKTGFAFSDYIDDRRSSVTLYYGRLMFALN